MDSSIKALEIRIRELERALDVEKKHAMETQRNLYKKDRRIKELATQVEEYKLKFKDAENTALNLESDLRTYKRRFDEVVKELIIFPIAPYNL
jgi:molecular chaperone GrpE (heat shock protein)